MSNKAHVQALVEKHANLEQIIAQELARPSPDQLKLTELKKRKLRIKEAITRLERGLLH
ncbi:MAG: DUF465 domain-containing protein [Alphaproteobacteria bacterium]|nr:MAG: DUF465 domain-containing protein [Alphaproteobacteria bacterium]